MDWLNQYSLKSSWQPEAIVNKRIHKEENIKSNWEYRKYMQQNGLKVMNYNTLESCYELGLDPSIRVNNTPSTNVPHLFRSTYDMEFPSYGYSNSDLKNQHIFKEKLTAKMVSPYISVSQNNVKNNYGYNSLDVTNKVNK